MSQSTLIPNLTMSDRIDRTRDFIMRADYNDVRHREALIRGLGIIVGNQTESERINRCTTQHNGRGFNAQDARFGTSVYVNAKRYGFSPRQFDAVKKMLKKYAKQIAVHTANMPTE